jgi:hypothetical protein
LKAKFFNKLLVRTFLVMDEHRTRLDVILEGFVGLLLGWLAVSL